MFLQPLVQFNEEFDCTECPNCYVTSLVQAQLPDGRHFTFGRRATVWPAPTAVLRHLAASSFSLPFWLKECLEAVEHDKLF